MAEYEASSNDQIYESAAAVSNAIKAAAQALIENRDALVGAGVDVPSIAQLERITGGAEAMKGWMNGLLLYKAYYQSREEGDKVLQLIVLQEMAEQAIDKYIFDKFKESVSHAIEQGLISPGDGAFMNFLGRASVTYLADELGKLASEAANAMSNGYQEFVQSPDAQDETVAQTAFHDQEEISAISLGSAPSQAESNLITLSGQTALAFNDGIAQQGLLFQLFHPWGEYRNGIVEFSSDKSSVLVELDRFDYYLGGRPTFVDGLWRGSVEGRIGEITNASSITEEEVFAAEAVKDLATHPLDMAIFSTASTAPIAGGVGFTVIFNENAQKITATGDINIVFAGSKDDEVFITGGISTVFGEDGQDTISGGYANDTFFGGADNDVLNGGGGGNTLYGNEGSDALISEGGYDKLYGGAGDDRLIGDGNDTLVGGDGNDLYLVGQGWEYSNLTFSDQGGSNDVNALGAFTDGVIFNYEKVINTDFRTVSGYKYDLTPSKLGDAFTGFSDVYENVTFKGTEGNDIIDGKIGDPNTPNVVNLIGIASVDGAGGKDLIDGAGLYSNIDPTVRNKVEYLTLKGGTDSDVIYGSETTDKLYGDDGADLLMGGKGNDILYGGVDLDVDILDGGEGADEFNIQAGDIIVNLDAGDKIFYNGVQLTGGANYQPFTIDPTESWPTHDPQYDGLEYKFVGSSGEAYAWFRTADTKYSPVTTYGQDDEGNNPGIYSTYHVTNSGLAILLPGADKPVFVFGVDYDVNPYHERLMATVEDHTEGFYYAQSEQADGGLSFADWSLVDNYPGIPDSIDYSSVVGAAYAHQISLYGQYPDWDLITKQGAQARVEVEKGGYDFSSHTWGPSPFNPWASGDGQQGQAASGNGGGGASGDGGAYVSPDSAGTTGDNGLPASAPANSVGNIAHDAVGVAGAAEPLVLDLNGDGLTLTGLSSSKVYFDLDANGFAERTAWVGGGDGLLAMDRNGNGIIDDITELFGTTEPLETATTTGFDSLGALDTNSDGKIDASDDAFSDLRVWVDADGDGLTDAGELKTLDELGIASISLQTTTDGNTINGNTVSETATFTKTDNSTGTIGDVWFGNSTYETVDMRPEVLPNWLTQLPGMRGYGEVTGLRTAMGLNGFLMQGVANLGVGDGPTDGEMLGSLSGQLGDIVNLWAVPDSNWAWRGDYVDGQHLAVVENFAGAGFQQASDPNVTNPDQQAGRIIETAWDEIVEQAGARLLVQGVFQPAFSSVSYDWATDGFTGTLDAGSAIATIAAEAPTGSDGAALSFWKMAVATLDAVASDLGVTTTFYDAALQNALTTSGLVVSLAALRDMHVRQGVDQAGSDETIITGDESTAVSGRAGSEHISAGAGNDLLDGGSGDDFIDGGAGNDTYFFGRGYGQDQINDVDATVGAADTVALGAGISPDDLLISQDPTDPSNLVLRIAGTGDALTIIGQLASADKGVEVIRFADGTEWDRSIFQGRLIVGTVVADANLTGTDYNDHIDGLAGADTMVGGKGGDTYVVDDPLDVVVEDADAGNDVVETHISYQLGTNVEGLVLLDGGITGTGNAGDNWIVASGYGGNVLDGGAGSDTLVGANGDDTYVVDNLGDKVIENDLWSYDIVKASLSWTLTDGLEELELTGTGNFDGTGNELDNKITGNGGDNTLTGDAGNDTLIGGGGNDTLVGGLGFDTAKFLGNIADYDVVQTAQGWTVTDKRSVALDGTDTVTGVEYLLFADGKIVLQESIDLTDDDAADNTVAENVATGTVVGLTIIGVDSDPQATVTYSLLDDAGGRFTIDEASGVVSVADGTLLNFEAGSSHTITVRAVGSNQIYKDQDFTIGVTNENEAPGAISDSDAAPDSVAENSANGTVVGVTALAIDPDVGDSLTYSLTNDAGGRFAIDGATGVVTVADGSLLDFEMAASRKIGITVRVTDSGGLTQDRDFTIEVTDVNEAPEVMSDSDLTRNSVAENAANGTAVGVTVWAVDLDANDNLTYSLTNDAGGRFAIDSATGVVTVANGSLLDFEAAASHDITVRATDSSGLTQDQDFTIDLADVNEAPSSIADADTAENAVVEHAANGTVVGITASGSDPDSGDTLTYSLTDDAGGRFAIDSTTGVVTVADGSLLDYNTAPSHSITVRATDSGGLTADQAFTINLSSAGGGGGDLTLTGTSGGDVLTGGAGNDTLNGLAGDDVLDGGAGADTLIGGTANDTYYVDSSGDSVNEAAGEGTDTVISSITWTLGSNLENLILSGTAGIEGYGNTLDNVITGNDGDNYLWGGAGNDTFDGGAGNDTMVGGKGNDTYYVDSTDDYGYEAAGEGTDTVISSVTWGLDTNFENLILTGTATYGIGNSEDNVITGNDVYNYLEGGTGNDTLDGGAGNDDLVGGTGDDTYDVDSSDDYIYEVAGEGIDSVYSTAHDWGMDSNVENLTLIGTAYGGYGNSLSNTIIGNTEDNALSGGGGDDYLDGGTGADWFYGGLGNDTYIFDNSGDWVAQTLTNGGIDTIRSSVSFGLSSMNINIQNVVLTGTANINLYDGNDLDNTITGNSGNNQIFGGKGNDVLDGGAGNDFLMGGGGNDTLTGGFGNDIAVFSGALEDYTISTAGGVVTITDNNTSDGDDGTDTITSVEIAQFGCGCQVNIAAPIVLDLDGNGVQLTQRGDNNAGIDLDGDGVADKTGWIGSGDGFLVVDRNGDGTFTDASELSFANDKPGAKSDLDGLSAFDSNADGEISSLDQDFGKFLVWQDANGNGIADAGETKTLSDAGVASISLAGIATNQTWDWNDSVVINSGAFQRSDGTTGSLADVAFLYDGSEKVSGASSSGVETGSNGSATGQLVTGHDGDDDLAGGSGNDTLVGGNGNDTFHFGRGGGSDVIIAYDTGGGNDTLQLGTGISSDQLWFRQVNGGDLEIDVIGSADRTTVRGWFDSTDYQLDSVALADGTSATAQGINNLVSAMSAFSPPPLGQTVLDQTRAAALAPTLAASWHSGA
jgi:Ca2+-binding RTX toxin-like protein